MGRKAHIRTVPDWSRTEWPDSVPGPFAQTALRQIKPTGFWTRWRHALVNIFKSTPVWEKEEAFYALLLAAAFADREIQKEEERELNALVARTPTLAALSDDRKSGLHKRLCRLLEKDEELYDVVVVAYDRPFLFASLCGAMAGFGLSIGTRATAHESDGHRDGSQMRTT